MCRFSVIFTRSLFCSLEKVLQLWGRDALRLFFEVESHQFEVEEINADDVMIFCLDLMNKMLGNLIIFPFVYFSYNRNTRLA